MITEDQLEQLAIQWQETLTPALSHGEKEEDGRLAEVRRRVAMPGRVRRSLGMMPTIKSGLMVRPGRGGLATCKGCLQVRLERNQKP